MISIFNCIFSAKCQILSGLTNIIQQEINNLLSISIEIYIYCTNHHKADYKQELSTKNTDTSLKLYLLFETLRYLFKDTLCLI